MSRAERESLQDALEHLTVLRAHLAGSDRDDQMVIDAAALRLSAAIDCVSLVSEETRTRAIDGVSWRIIKSMRNRIVHAYGFMDPAILRATFDDDIGGFERDVRHLLETLRIG